MTEKKQGKAISLKILGFHGMANKGRRQSGDSLYCQLCLVCEQQHENPTLSKIYGT